MSLAAEGSIQRPMKVLVIDIGGTHIKVASTDHLVPTKVVSGPTMNAKQMVTDVLAVTKDWEYDAISIGYPGPVVHDRPLAEPHNLAAGWVGFPYQTAFPKPVRFLNDAAMQALGGYTGGKMLFLGIGTGLGSALIVDHVVIALELAHLPYKRGRTYEEYIGLAGLERRGKKEWRLSVLDVVERFPRSLRPRLHRPRRRQRQTYEEAPQRCPARCEFQCHRGRYRPLATKARVTHAPHRNGQIHRRPRRNS